MNKNVVADDVFMRDRSGVKNVGLLHKYRTKNPAVLNQQYFGYRKRMMTPKRFRVSLKVSLTGR